VKPGQPAEYLMETPNVASAGLPRSPQGGPEAAKTTVLCVVARSLDAATGDREIYPLSLSWLKSSAILCHNEYCREAQDLL
jgi:hypothetical protein